MSCSPGTVWSQTLWKAQPYLSQETKTHLEASELADYTMMIAYAVLALGASFLCSILEAVLLSTSHGHIVALKDTHAKVSATWAKWKDAPEGPLTAILT